MSETLRICETCAAFDPENLICNKNGLPTDNFDSCGRHETPEEEEAANNP